MFTPRQQTALVVIGGDLDQRSWQPFSRCDPPETGFGPDLAALAGVEGLHSMTRAHERRTPRMLFAETTLCVKSLVLVKMLVRGALRAASSTSFRTSYRLASTFSASATEAMNPHGIEISKAQRIAKDGFISGTGLSTPQTTVFELHID